MVKAKIILLAAGAFLACSCCHSFKWEHFIIDGHRTGVGVPTANNVSEALGSVTDGVYTAPNGKIFEGGSTPEVASLLIEVQPKMAHLKEVIAYAPVAMDRHHPESNLTNFIDDRLFADVQRLCEPDGRKVDLAFTNYGGIRCDIPAGDVLLDDIIDAILLEKIVPGILCNGMGTRQHGQRNQNEIFEVKKVFFHFHIDASS